MKRSASVPSSGLDLHQAKTLRRISSVNASATELPLPLCKACLDAAEPNDARWAFFTGSSEFLGNPVELHAVIDVDTLACLSLVAGQSHCARIAAQAAALDTVTHLLSAFVGTRVVAPVWAQPTKPAAAVFGRILSAVKVALTAMGGNGAAISTGTRVLGATALDEALTNRIKACLLDAQKAWNMTPYSALGVHAANFHVNGESSSRRTTAAYYTGNTALSGLPAGHVQGGLKTPLPLPLAGHGPASSPVPLLSVASIRADGTSASFGGTGAGAMPSAPRTVVSGPSSSSCSPGRPSPPGLDWSAVATLVKAKAGIGASATVVQQQHAGGMDMDYTSEYSSSCSSGALHCADCGCDIPMAHGQGAWGAGGLSATSASTVWPHAHPPQHWTPVDTLQARAKGSRVSVEVEVSSSSAPSLGPGLALGLQLPLGAGKALGHGMMEDEHGDGASRGRSDTGRSASSLAVGLAMGGTGLPGPSPAGLAQLSAWQAAGYRSASTLPVSAFTVSCPTPPPSLPAQSPFPSVPSASTAPFAAPVATHPFSAAAWAAVGGGGEQHRASRATWVRGGEEEGSSQGGMDEDL